MCGGYSLVELLFVVALSGVLTAVAVPPLLAGLHQSRTVAAARYLSGRMALARAQAIARSATVALRFESAASGITVAVFADRNANGVRASEIAAGVDVPVGMAVSLGDLFPGVAIALGEEADSRAVRIGGTTLLSFTPLGTASAGSIYLRGRDGTQLVLRVLGVTGRVRLLRFVPSAGEWREML